MTEQISNETIKPIEDPRQRLLLALYLSALRDDFDGVSILLIDAAPDDRLNLMATVASQLASDVRRTMAALGEDLEASVADLSARHLVGEGSETCRG